MPKHRGFTLAESLITLAIIGVVASITVPVLRNKAPNQNVLMLQKAYNLSTKIVGEIKNDEYLYPNFTNQGFADLATRESHGVKYGGESKFCGLFAERLNNAGNADCSHDIDLPAGNFETADGITWKVPQCNFGSNGANNTALSIQIDVNGDKGPNCEYSNNCPNADRYTFSIDRWGDFSMNRATKKLLTTKNISGSVRDIVNR